MEKDKSTTTTSISDNTTNSSSSNNTSSTLRVESKESKEVSRTGWVYLMTLGVSTGSVCFGYNLAVISGTMLYAQPALELDSSWQSAIVGAAMISAAVSSLLCGRAADRLGRRLTLLLTAVLCVVGSILAAAASGKEMLLAGRIFTGLTFPPIVAFGPMYIAEMSVSSVRGRLMTIYQLLKNAGILLSAVASGASSYFVSNQWRYMLGFGAVPGLLFGIVMFLLPETPRWLIARGRHPQATRVLQRIYGREDVSDVVENIKQSVSSNSPTGSGVCSTVVRVLTTPHVLKALAVGNCLAFFFVWSGLNVILFFGGLIIKSVGFPAEMAVWIQGLIPLAIFMGQLPGVLAVEKYGRRPIVLVSVGASAVCLVLVSVGFHLTAANIPEVHLYFNGTNSSLPLRQSVCYASTGCEACIQDADCGLCYKGMSAFCLPALDKHSSTVGPCAVDDQRDEAFKFTVDFCPSPFAWVVIAGMFFFQLFFSSGLPGLTFPINAEIYPMWARGTCTSVVVAVFWVSNIIITFSYTTIVQAFNMYGTFWFFAAMCSLGFVLLAIFLPETKNRTLEEVEELFMTSQQLLRHREQRESNQMVLPGKEQEMRRASLTNNQDASKI